MKKFKFILLGVCVFALCGFRFPADVCRDHKISMTLCSKRVVAQDILKAKIPSNTKIKLLDMLHREQILESVSSEQSAKEAAETRAILIDFADKIGKNLQKAYQKQGSN